MRPGELARVVWAFARLEYLPGPLLIGHAVGALRSRASHFSDRDAANLLWALARLEEVPENDAIRDIAVGLAEVAGMYSGQSAAMVLWAMATLTTATGPDLTAPVGHPLGQQERLLQELAGAVARDVPILDPQSISMAAWALGTLRMADARIADAVAGSCSATEVLTPFEPQHLANLMWGLAKAGNKVDSSLLEAVATVSHSTHSCLPEHPSRSLRPQ